MNIPRTALFMLFWTLFLVYELPVAVMSTAVVGSALWQAWKIVVWVIGI